MDVKNIKIGQKVWFPALQFTPEKTSCGFIHYSPLNRTDSKVAAIDITKVGRWNERVFSFECGKTFLLSRRKCATSLKGTDGAVYFSKRGRGWAHHPKLAQYRSACRNRKSRKQFAEDIFSSWDGQLRFKRETVSEDGFLEQSGLRPPQLGALHAMGAHWSIDSKIATIVMPTGTGKTETMLAGMVEFMRGRVLVVVPTVALREQTVRKFRTLGLLREIGVLPDNISTPVVGELTKRPKTKTDLNFINHCNVVVTNISNIAQGTAAELGQDISKLFDYLLIDEAHHVPAATWDELRENFSTCKVLQFTATPFRRDRKPVDGKVIFNYPLGMAQKDGYFNEIAFHPILGIDSGTADEKIAKEAISVLDADLSDGFDHLIMARCAKISRAKAVLKLYEGLGAKHKPVLITSETKKTERRQLIEQLRKRRSRILICVDMFGEGFDFPNLKIAAIHDAHRSLAIMLQFTGRFTRTAEDVGTAKVVADVANSGFMNSLDELYSEDADWNQLLSEFSSEAIKSHIELVEFLSKCTLVDTGQDEVETPISPSVLQPKFSMVAFEVEKFQPNHFHKAIPNNQIVKWAWLTKDKHTAFFVTMQDPKVAWSRSRQVRNREWDFFVLHYDKSKKLLYLNASDTSSVHQELANEVSGGTAKAISGDSAFRILGNVRRLCFQKVGLKRPGRRNISYSSFSGVDVGAAISESQKSTAAKSDISGIGYENGVPVSLGCSKKGRVWSREQGSIQGLVTWCGAAGGKLMDSTIDTSKILENTMVPEMIESLPDKEILRIDWPLELLTKSEANIKITSKEEEDISHYEVNLVSLDKVKSSVTFSIDHEEHSSEFLLMLGGANQYSISHTSGPKLTIKIGSRSRPMEEYLHDYPPGILFVDGSELDGCLLYELKNRVEVDFPPQSVESWDWSGTDLKKESKWKQQVKREDSIQYKVIEKYIGDDYDIVFDDDGSGEAADVVCIRETADEIELLLLHCKYSSGATPGSRVKDVIEVCAQAAKSNRWIWRFSRLCEHLSRRENSTKKADRRSRFERGNASKLNHLKKASRFKPVKAEIIVVQPGINKQAISDDQAIILTGAHSYLLETVNVPLSVISS